MRERKVRPMISREYTLAKSQKTARKQRMDLIEVSCCFSSSITIEHEQKHFNGKSIMKAGELTEGEAFRVVAEGKDEREAIEAFDRLFSEKAAG